MIRHAAVVRLFLSCAAVAGQSAFGQAAAPSRLQMPLTLEDGLEAAKALNQAWRASQERESSPADRLANEEGAALSRVKRILDRGGAVSKEDKAFLRERLPRFMARGLVGRAPVFWEKSMIEKWFPKLAREGAWQVTGEASYLYNCVAWSVGVIGDWLWLPSYRPDDFDALYLSYGYIPLGPGEPVEDADVAFLKDSFNVATHACRHVTGDIWESKLGPEVRILHRLEDLEGAKLGHVAKYYRRATAQELAKLGVVPPLGLSAL